VKVTNPEMRFPALERIGLIHEPMNPAEIEKSVRAIAKAILEISRAMNARESETKSSPDVG
jgi:hypothetical protein